MSLIIKVCSHLAPASCSIVHVCLVHLSCYLVLKTLQLMGKVPI